MESTSVDELRVEHEVAAPLATDGGVAPGPAHEIALLTPTGRDASLAERVLRKAGLHVHAYAEMASLCEAMTRGVGAIVIAEEALASRSSPMLLAQLGAQPSWSDVPVIVLTGEDELSRSIPRALEALASRANVTLLERPIRLATIVTVLRSALRARQRQYDVRDHLDERRRMLENERVLREHAEHAATRAAEANRAKSEFLAMMSHELRTPLNAIAGYTQLLEMGVRGPITPEQQSYLSRIERSQRHLLSLINDVLNFAKIEAGRLKYDIRRVRMHDVLFTVETLVAPQLRAKNLHYVDSATCVDIAVLADEEKVQQIVINLLSNAIKFTPSGGSIRIECATMEGFVHTTVHDNGTGIPADKLEAIFEPFIQVERALAGRQEGTGLGLAISRDLARGMGGDLLAASTIGRGSSFTLVLPRALADDSRQ